MRKNIFKLFILINFLFFCGLPNFSLAALRGTTNNGTISLSPNIGVYKVGAAFPIDIMFNTHGQQVVAVAAYFTFDPVYFQIDSIDTSQSIFNDPSSKESDRVIDNVNGILKIGRGNPGSAAINTTNGKLATIYIKGKANTAPPADNFHFTFTAGVTSVDSDMILIGDEGTDILSGVDEGRYTLDGTAPANVTSFTATAGDSQVALSWANPSSDFAGVTILRKTGSYPASVTDGTVVYDSNGTSYVDTGLANSTIYYYKAFSRDIVVNYSSGVQAYATPKDNIAPASITTLSATALTARTVRLDWTAVGDDGTAGTAATYDIRYSTSPITASNFSSATQISGEPNPQNSGAAEVFAVGGLTGNATYYFAAKTIDENSNISAISNIVSAKTFRTADLNNDNIVGTPDFGILMSNWGLSTRPAADINQDGLVGTPDFGIMMTQWG